MTHLASVASFDAARSATLPALTSGAPPTSGDHSTEPRRGPWEYRLRNGRFTLLEQLLLKLGAPAADRLAAFNRSPHKILRQIAADTDLKPELVARCLSAVLEGAPVSRVKGAILRILAPTDSGWGRKQGLLRAERLVKDRDFAWLAYDINYARGVIAHQWPRTDGRLINDAGAAIDENASKFQRLAHILAGAETAVLRAVADELGPQIEMTPDGWRSPVRLDVRRLKTRIQRRTGYGMSIVGKRRKIGVRRLTQTIKLPPAGLPNTPPSRCPIE
jgi:hypothetical protein